MISPISFGTRLVGQGYPVFVIAEAGVNHNGDREMALELVRAAHECGADAVKFQTFKAEDIVTMNAPKAAYQLEVTDGAESQIEMLRKIELPEDSYEDLMGLCDEIGIEFLSTAYNFRDVDFLMQKRVNAIKIASGQMVETPFLEYASRAGVPLIVSTGMCSMEEVREGIGAIRGAGNPPVIMLQCTTNYPSAVDDANLRAMVTLENELEVLVGYSDHTETDHTALASVALGAVVIEKHFTLDKMLPGPDHTSSCDPSDLTILIEGIRAIEAALGSGHKVPTERESRNIRGMRRSVVSLRPIAAGQEITREVLGFKRPATGIAPRRLMEVVGRKARVDIPADIPLKEDMIIW